MPNKLVGFGVKVLNVFSLANGDLFGKEEVMLEIYKALLNILSISIKVAVFSVVVVMESRPQYLNNESIPVLKVFSWLV